MRYCTLKNKRGGIMTKYSKKIMVVLCIIICLFVNTCYGTNINTNETDIDEVENTTNSSNRSTNTINATNSSTLQSTGGQTTITNVRAR